MAQDLTKMCRTCLDKALPATSLFTLQYINQKELSLAQMLTASTSIMVLEDDSLPKQVCSQCEVNIFNTYNFLQQCKKSDSLLQTIITDANIKLESRHPHIHIASANSTLEPSMDVSNIFNSSNLGQETDDQNDTDNFENEVNTVSEVVEQPMKKIVILIDQHESYNNISDNFEEVYINSPYTFNENQINFSHYNDNRGIKELNIQKSNIPLEDETMQPLFACEAKGCFSCFTSPTDLKLHNRTHTSKQNICELCNKMFSSASTLSRHMASKHQPEKKTRVCRECGKSFSRSDDLKRHIRVHTGDRPFSCEKCGKAFSQSFRLLEHIRSHSNVKNFICAVCGKGFARYTSLLVHNKTHNQVKSHECTECGKRLCGATSLSRHMKMHSGLKNFACGFCKKRFASASNLVVHKRTHTVFDRNFLRKFGQGILVGKKGFVLFIVGERPYPCLTCGKSFPDNSRLNVHSRIHSGEKPYICTSCGRGCISSTQLKRHMRIHTGEKPFCCYICSKCFMRSEELKNHIRIHKGERNHVCAVCSKGFFQKNTLKVHMRIHTGEKPFSCNVCHKSFSQSGPYCIHIKTHCTEETCTTQQTEGKSGDANYL
ncbi:gastrula zinc finger protein XlCGF57.1-like isoform X1 [Dendroctonus ponderosae]|uniref:gastrula zinc finger protein XlCGF57.1-like isoform X1 n=3 Tax=Dendroctonus ponderosae TaxID=77166 RepID=UPI0020363973|nr:gastrula zinc finger protein XlCGF57.1-like isoform X1 [Dendroctonus ponderosae]